MPQHTSTSGAGGILFFHYSQTADLRSFGVHSLHPHSPINFEIDYQLYVSYLCLHVVRVEISYCEGQSASWVRTVT